MFWATCSKQVSQSSFKQGGSVCWWSIFIISMCILLFCFKSFFLLVLLLCFPAVLAHFVHHFPKARGRFFFFMHYVLFWENDGQSFLLSDLFSTKVLPQYRFFFLYQVCFQCFRISALEISFKLKKSLLNCTVLYFVLNMLAIRQELG